MDRILRTSNLLEGRLSLCVMDRSREQGECVFGGGTDAESKGIRVNRGGWDHDDGRHRGMG